MSKITEIYFLCYNLYILSRTEYYIYYKDIINNLIDTNNRYIETFVYLLLTNNFIFIHENYNEYIQDIIIDINKTYSFLSEYKINHLINVIEFTDSFNNLSEKKIFFFQVIQIKEELKTSINFLKLLVSNLIDDIMLITNKCIQIVYTTEILTLLKDFTLNVHNIKLLKENKDELLIIDENTSKLILQINKSIDKRKIQFNIDDYYLVSYTRYYKPLDKLIPFGSFVDLERECNTEIKINDLDRIKAMKLENITDNFLDGTSQYGIYFKLIPKIYLNNCNIYNRDDYKFIRIRTFIFDLRQFLNYIELKTTIIPLFWYADGNNYGYKNINSTIFTNISTFENNIRQIFSRKEKLQDHECLCIIPIPLNEETGFIGKINNTYRSTGIKKID